jgi:hypothetical protein
VPAGGCHSLAPSQSESFGRQAARRSSRKCFVVHQGGANEQLNISLKEELKMAKQKTKKPHVIKAGRGIRAKLWKNSNKNGEWFNVTVTRVYKDDDGEFQDSDSFSRDDLLQVAYVTQKAFDYIINQTDDEEESDEE